jgi:hypothetical protein
MTHHLNAAAGSINQARISGTRAKAAFDRAAQRATLAEIVKATNWQKHSIRASSTAAKSTASRSSHKTEAGVRIPDSGKSRISAAAREGGGFAAGPRNF